MSLKMSRDELKQFMFNSINDQVVELTRDQRERTLGEIQDDLYQEELINRDGNLEVPKITVRPSYVMYYS